MNGFLDKAKELAQQAREKAAQGVDAAASKVDEMTGGKYTEHIENVSNKVENALDPNAGDEGQNKDGRA
ncbi:antitoxin [Actinoalloteichus sp. AHMU CJ021]|uniref:MT0933-like antitoxin protein n=1 Tax=Actinoalloteichus caeruleus DSM 43889 TaxID=1120930 RepID=A0ABT1JIZ0_ACTCY|nr:antitoxin [Actinoalloteichus caeruleus]AUS78401.1 antitoxin [Actinoalloteichus sp. AHMU CJ021]MCP2332482.1 MT0933-like antitoxin protein [Actinoalloteichus caeruleus DSM 43889]